MDKFPTQIHVLLARHAPVGLVIRRGPSKRVATVLWDRRRDEFQLGQWLKGRIYERRSDLSPDGRHFIYFASNNKSESKAKGAWTAVSCAPYLKALAVFPKGDNWHGGGLWTENDRYWLNDGDGHSILRNTKKVRRDRKFTPTDDYGNACPGVYYLRLLRDGWRRVDRGSVADGMGQVIFEKPLTHGWSLRKIACAQSDSPEGEVRCWDEHELVHPKTGKSLSCVDWEWAELDKQRLIWASHGRLFSGSLDSSGVAKETELFAFNPMRFEAIKAPS